MSAPSNSPTARVPQAAGFSITGDEPVSPGGDATPLPGQPRGHTTTPGAARVSILVGDCRTLLTSLPENSVQCCVTSPPYFGLRNYKVDGQIGLEPTPHEYIREMVAVFSVVRRVLKDDGVLWLNLGDSYANVGKWGGSSGGKHVKELHGATGVGREKKDYGTAKPKDLCMIPARVAIALQEDGWYLRAACPWIKRNGMPDSTTSRPTQCIETVFMLTKSRDCYYDAEAVKKMAKEISVKRLAQPNYENQVGSERANAGDKTNGNMKAVGGSTRLRRTSDWFFESWQGLLLDSDDEPSAFVVNTKGYKGAHFATYPPKLVEPCVLSSTSERGECPQCGKAWIRVVDHTPMVIDRSERTHEFGRSRSSGTMVSPAFSVTTGWRAQCDCGCEPVPQTILDPFGGSGTTGEVAIANGRNAILCELNPEYADLARQRCNLNGGFSE